MMPRLNGLDFCKLLKNDEISSHIPIIMLTAKASLNDRIEGLELGADDYLAKPFNSQELQIRVQNFIKNRERLQEKYQQNIALVAPSSTPPKPTVEDKFLSKVNAIIEQNVSDSTFNIENLGESLNISSVQLRRKLKALTNQTSVEYLRNYRLEKAATMLKNKEGNVSEVAYSVGFESISYFSKTFQVHFGVKPSDW
jgi:YesN/AraC family two-component response regulator